MAASNDSLSVLYRPIGSIEELQRFLDLHGQWADEIFPQQTPLSILGHCHEEIGEILANAKYVLEYAEAALLFFEALRASGFTLQELLQAMQIKHQICLQRKGKNGRHVKDGF